MLGIEWSGSLIFKLNMLEDSFSSKVYKASSSESMREKQSNELFIFVEESSSVYLNL